MKCFKFFARGNKFDAPLGNDFKRIEIPINTFSNCLDDETGDIITSCEKK